MKRRRFLQASLATGLSLPLSACLSPKGSSANRPLFTRMGINASFDQAEAVAAAGADFLLQPVNSFLRPDEPVAEFEKELRRLDQSPIPVLTCNLFLMGRPLRTIGPEARHENVLRFAETAFERARRAGVERIVFGSSGSRNRPEGWSKARADAQFIPLLEKMGDLAGEQGVIVAVENLQKNQCNYLTRISEVAALIEAVGHTHVRMLADIYHSSHMQDPPSEFGKYAHLTDMVEIAERVDRAAPGFSGQDFSPYFDALRSAGYSGPIEIEASWEIDQIARAFELIHEQSTG